VSSGLPSLLDTFSASAADYDRDGDLDLFLAHWQVPMQASHLWRNNGHGVFQCVDDAAGLDDIGDGRYDWSFTGNFSDLNGDAWPDLLVASDFLTSRVFLNRRDGTFSDATTPVITDENGMGAAVGDYDNDGDMDWFVSSIFEVNGIPRDEWGITGNRMYRNRGDGSFDDATDVAGVRQGGWGWGSSFADFNNDGWLDLFHVNGWPIEVDTFLEDPARLFMNDGQGGFVESSGAAGVASTAQGRGVVCFDYDRDGDVDIFIANYRGAPQLLRNDSPPGAAWLSLTLRRHGSNAPAVGARVRITAGSTVQTRDVMCGNNYLSQNPAVVHVGLGSSPRADELRIDWPNRTVTTLTGLDALQELLLEEPEVVAVPQARAIRILSAQPNPFNAEITLPLEGAEGGATAVVYDVAGRVVRTLQTSDGAPVRWDGRDARGARAPAGVYWVRVTVGASSDTRRVVLIR
jgi:enediyne biosynthesis protein E4